MKYIERSNGNEYEKEFDRMSKMTEVEKLYYRIVLGMVLFSVVATFLVYMYKDAPAPVVPVLVEDVVLVEEVNILIKDSKVLELMCIEGVRYIMFSAYKMKAMTVKYDSRGFVELCE